MSSKRFLPLIILSVLLVVIAGLVVLNPLLFKKTDALIKPSLDPKAVTLQLNAPDDESSWARTFTVEGDQFMHDQLLVPLAKSRGIYFENEPSTCNNLFALSYTVDSQSSTPDFYKGSASIYPSCPRGFSVKFIIDKKNKSMQVAQVDTSTLYDANIPEQTYVPLEKFLAQQEPVKEEEKIDIITSYYNDESHITFNHKGDAFMAQGIIDPLMAKLGLTKGAQEMLSRCGSGVSYSINEATLFNDVNGQKDKNFFHGSVYVNRGCEFHGVLAFRLAIDGSSLEIAEDKVYMSASEWVKTKADTWIEQAQKKS